MKRKQILIAAFSLLMFARCAHAGGGPDTNKKEAPKSVSLPLHHTSAGAADAHGDESAITVRKEGTGEVVLEIAGGVLTAASVKQAGADLLDLDEENTVPLVISVKGVTANDPTLWAKLVKGVMKLGSVVKLSLTNCHLTNTAVGPVLTALQKCHDLTRLDLSGNPLLTDESGALIKELVARPGSKLSTKDIKFSGTGISTPENPSAKKVGASGDMATAIRQEEQKRHRRAAQEHLHGAVASLAHALTGHQEAGGQGGTADHISKAIGALGSLLGTWGKK